MRCLFVPYTILTLARARLFASSRSGAGQVKAEDPHEVELSRLFTELRIDGRSIGGVVSEPLQLVTLKTVAVLPRVHPNSGHMRRTGSWTGYCGQSAA